MTCYGNNLLARWLRYAVAYACCFVACLSLRADDFVVLQGVITNYWQTASRNQEAFGKYCVSNVYNINSQDASSTNYFWSKYGNSNLVWCYSSPANNALAYQNGEISTRNSTNDFIISPVYLPGADYEDTTGGGGYNHIGDQRGSGYASVLGNQFYQLPLRVGDVVCLVSLTPWKWVNTNVINGWIASQNSTWSFQFGRLDSMYVTNEFDYSIVAGQVAGWGYTSGSFDNTHQIWINFHTNDIINIGGTNMCDLNGYAILGSNDNWAHAYYFYLPNGMYGISYAYTNDAAYQYYYEKTILYYNPNYGYGDN